MADSDAAAVRELLRDSFTRLIEHVEDLTDGLTDEVAFFRPTGTANSIAWQIWHSARVQDAQLCDIAGIEEVWTRDGWVDRFGLEDAALRHVARIVRGADTARLDLEPQAAGLLAMALGLSAVYEDDHAALAAGMALYDGLYGWARFARGDTHNWPAAPAPG